MFLKRINTNKYNEYIEYDIDWHTKQCKSDHQRKKYRDKKDDQEYVEKPFHIQNTTSALAYAVQRRFYHFYYNAVKDSWQQKYLLWLIAESDIIKIKDRV